MLAIKSLGHELLPINTRPLSVDRREATLPQRILRKIRGPRDLAGVNLKILQLLSKTVFDILWIDKGLTVYPETLKLVKSINPKMLLVGYSPDDMLNPRNQTRAFLKGLPLYDYFFTTKSYGVRELEEIGAKKVIFVGNAFEPSVHHPYVVTAEDRRKYGGQVGFIGDYEADRAESMFYLAKNGIPVRIWGTNWRKNKFTHKNFLIEMRPLLGSDYAKAISCFDINLAFLRKINRDLQTTRTMEIPACKGFMLAERTGEHLQLFTEGVEAEYFSDNEELLAKVKFYLKNKKQRQKIALNGFNRAQSSGYSNLARMSEIFEIIERHIALVGKNRTDF